MYEYGSIAPPTLPPIVTFDTSAHNRFEREGEAADPIIARIRSSRFVRLAGLSIEEMIGTPDETLRSALFTCAEKLIAGSESDTLMPPGELVRCLILEHEKNPWSFDWTLVNVQSGDYHDEVSARQLVFDEELCAQTRQQFKELAARDKRLWTETLRPRLDDYFLDHPESPRPRTLDEAVKVAENTDHKMTTDIAQGFYRKVTGRNISRVVVDEFMSVCPPFKALVYSSLLPWYDKALCDPLQAERYKSGRADLQMAVYLPYCHEFVTDEKYGEQERCLRKIAEVIGLPTQVLSYAEFVRRLPA